MNNTTVTDYAKIVINHLEVRTPLLYDGRSRDEHNCVGNDNIKSETARNEIMIANKTGPKYVKSQEVNDK